MCFYFLFNVQQPVKTLKLWMFTVFYFQQSEDAKIVNFC